MIGVRGADAELRCASAPWTAILRWWPTGRVCPARAPWSACAVRM